MNRKLLSKYIDQNRLKFSPELFERNDNDIIDAIKDIILSSQCDGYYTIRVESFTVVEDYAEIARLLTEYQFTYKSKDKSRRKENIYELINLKDSDIKLLIVKYFISIQGKSTYLDVYINIPRIVDKYYLRIAGNEYSAMYQIVDASTYNNITSTSKYPNVTLKTTFQPIRIYRYSDNIISTNSDEVKVVYYYARIFNKSILAMKYSLAKLGFIGTITKLNMQNIINIGTEDLSINNDNLYTFHLNNTLYISIPKIILDTDYMAQSIIYTLIKTVKNKTTLEEIFSEEYWLLALGDQYSTFTVEKGNSIIKSLERLYDIDTRKNLSLPEELKENIYDILNWMMSEFNYLRQKDNLNVAIKRLRLSGYMASLYAVRLSKNIYLISDQGKRANIDSIKKALLIQPNFLISQIVKCNLVNYKNVVNDLDSITALKFSYKGESGLGENGTNSIPDIYRNIHISHLGRLDLDSSSATDPGISGTLVPFIKPTEKGFFTDYEEPSSWRTEFDELLKIYNDSIGLLEISEFNNQILGEENYDELMIRRQAVACIGKYIIPAIVMDDKE